MDRFPGLLARSVIGSVLLLMPLAKSSGSEVDLVDLLLTVDQEDIGLTVVDIDSDLVRQVAREIYWRTAFAPNNRAEYGADRVNDRLAQLAEISGDDIVQGYARLSSTSLIEEGVRETAVEETIELFRGGGSSLGEADARRCLGRIHYDRSEFEQAITQLGTAIRLYLEIGDEVSRAPCLLDLAEALRSADRYLEAESAASDAVAVFTALDDAGGLVQADISLSSARIALGKGEAAEAVLMRSLATLRNVGNVPDEARVLSNLGMLWDRTGKPEQAMKAYAEALEIRRRQGAEFEMALILNNIGVLLLNTGEPRAALLRFEEVIGIAERSGKLHLIQMACHNAGEAHRYCGEFGEALAMLGRAFDLAESMGLTAAQAAIQGSTAAVQVETGELAKAEATYRRILERFEALGMDAEASTARISLARLELKRGAVGTAAVLLEQSLTEQKLRRDWTGASLSLRLLGDAALDSDDLGRAVERYTGSLAYAESIRDPAAMGRVLIGIGSVYIRQEQLSDAVSAFRLALRYGEECGAADLIVSAGTGLGHALAQAGQIKQAREAYETAIASIERSRTSLDQAELQIGYFERKQNPYHGLAYLGLENGDPEGAWVAFERARARSLLQLMEDADVDLNDLEPLPGLRETEPGSETGRSCESLQEPETLGLGKLLPDHRLALIQYEISGDDIWLLTASRSKSDSAAGGVRIACYRLDITPDELRPMVTELVERCQKRSISARLDTLRHRLFDLLLAPALQDLEGVEVLGIMPTDVLWHLPFGALLDENGTNLIESYALFEVPSVRTLQAISERSHDKISGGMDQVGKSGFGRCVVFSNPDLSGVPDEISDRFGGFPEIPFTEQQAESVVFAAGQDVSIYLGSDATEQRVVGLGSGIGILHFATHGVYDPISPMRSGLLLSADGQFDGFLEAREILEYKVHANLVVFGACRTALGQPRRGEGIRGLSWAVLAAGSSSAILSLWAIDDASTCEFMEGFYRRMGEVFREEGETGSCKLAAGLQQAQQMLIADGRSAHPFYWASSVLVGDSD